MKKKSFQRLTARCLAWWLLLLALPLRAEPDPPGSTVLFAFDDVWLPFQQGVRLNMLSYESQGLPGTKGNQVVAPGPGVSDSNGIIYYGSVCEVNGELLMWYLGLGNREPGDPEGEAAGTRGQIYRVHLAKSRDGRHWDKPKLRVVEYGGTRDNNLVDLGGGSFSVVACSVLFDPEDPDPARRFKMAFESAKYNKRLAVAFSADGIHWRESSANPVGPTLEMCGLTKWNRAYYVNGQGGSHWSQNVKARSLVTHMSYDFEQWTTPTALGFRRDPVPPRVSPRTNSTDGEQVHLGAALWNRGNVIMGFYGQWHGHPSNDRRYVSIDTGFLLSHDAMHFTEPVPDFRIVQARETPPWWLSSGKTMAMERAPAVMQGQGFANVGDETLFWYGIWVIPSAGVRLARWERDRLGYLQPFLGRSGEARVISAPIAISGRPVTVSVNAAGLGQWSQIKVTMLDEQFHELPGYTAKECTGPQQSGLHQRVTWGNNFRVSASGAVRVCIDFGGVRPEDLRLYAVYVEPAK
ncbi:MAG: hypothetical protein EXS37_12815 [Opitutus sp.]|nr:hypothetical protein [Opitutus sp.]